ncbi:peptide ABC transporter substrate-binding protein [bacterium]|nr:peptide ABC transporter substrate-binding protein [bacterium]
MLSFLKEGVREKILLAVRSFGKTWKIIFFGLLFVFLASGAGILHAFNSFFLIDVPQNGGTLSEGLVGSPRFINPVLAASDADKDLSALVYSGLTRVSENGTIIPDLAESYSVSPDGKVYTFILKENLHFHDGGPLTSEDVRFTIEKIKDPELRSVKRGNFEGVVIEAPDPRTVVFTLSAPYAPFLANTTVGILPAALWENLSTEEWNFSALNTHPIGSGPYRVNEVRENQSGIPEYYDLISFPLFALGEPSLHTLRFYFYANEEELSSGVTSGKVESFSTPSPLRALEFEKNGAKVVRAPLPRVFGVFFNQSEQELFTDPSVRKALDMSVDREYIVENILYGFGTALSGPFSPGTGAYQEGEQASTTLSQERRIEEAREILRNAGWTYSEEEKNWTKKEKGPKSIEKTLSFSLSTSDAPELKAVAEAVLRNFEALGAKVTLKIFESGDLNQNVIRPRKYEALLFGEIIGRDPDPFAFWHSSQRLDPGLNIAMYANVSADKILQELRETREEERAILYREFEDKIKEDTPAIFLYSPEFIYVLPSRVFHAALPPIVHPFERFSQIHMWHIETEKIWKIFAK